MKSTKTKQGPKHLKIHTFPDSSKESVTEKDKDRLIIRVREPREDNRANDRILEILRMLYPNTIIRMTKGHHSSHKIVSIEEK